MTVSNKFILPIFASAVVFSGVCHADMSESGSTPASYVFNSTSTNASGGDVVGDSKISDNGWIVAVGFKQVAGINTSSDGEVVGTWKDEIGVDVSIEYGDWSASCALADDVNLMNSDGVAIDGDAADITTCRLGYTMGRVASGDDSQVSVGVGLWGTDIKGTGGGYQADLSGLEITTTMMYPLGGGVSLGASFTASTTACDTYDAAGEEFDACGNNNGAALIVALGF